MGTDVNASASTSSSATSGAQHHSVRGDVIFGSKPTPSWVWLSLAAFGVIALVVFRTR